MTGPWKLQKNGRILCKSSLTPHCSRLRWERLARNKDTWQIQMAATQLDFPYLRIKPSADVTACGYALVVEKYTGARS